MWNFNNTASVYLYTSICKQVKDICMEFWAIDMFGVWCQAKLVQNNIRKYVRTCSLLPKQKKFNYA